MPDPKLSDVLRPQEILTLIASGCDPEQYAVIETLVPPSSIQVGIQDDRTVVLVFQVGFKPGMLTGFNKVLYDHKGSPTNQFTLALPPLVRLVLPTSALTEAAQRSLLDLIKAQTPPSTEET